MSTRRYEQRTLIMLGVFSGGHCAFPGCPTFLGAMATAWDRAEHLAIIAHIEASSDNGPRANPALDRNDRDKYENLILLCPTHHDLIDKQGSTYTVAEIRGWKVAIEQWASRQRLDKIGSVDFAALSVVCDAIAASDEIESTAMVAVPPDDKVRKNGLGPRSVAMLKMGLTREPLVSAFLERMASTIDARFPTRLRAGFVREYDRLRSEEGATGDDLFFGLLSFAQSAVSQNDTDEVTAFELGAAALAVVSHLFHICEIFEAPDAPS